MRLPRHILAFITLLLIPHRARAAISVGGDGTTMTVTSWTGIDPNLGVADVIANIANVLATTIEAICVTIFVAGALLFIISAGNEQRKTLGKDMMISSVIGFAVVLASQGIMNAVLWFLYPS